MRSEKELDFLEKSIPHLAENALAKAYLDTLANGHSVVTAIDGKLYEIFPDGAKKFIKNIKNKVKLDVLEKSR